MNTNPLQDIDLSTLEEIFNAPQKCTSTHPRDYRSIPCSGLAVSLWYAKCNPSRRVFLCFNLTREVYRLIYTHGFDTHEGCPKTITECWEVLPI